MGENFSAVEFDRLQAMSVYEIELKAKGFVRIAGIDEAGRGPLAGPVVAAACILPDGFLLENLNDSKQLTPEEREVLYGKITAHATFGIGISDVKTIDRVNILQATFLAMQKAVKAMTVVPDYLLIDGDRLPRFKVPCKAIVEGDGRSISIAAASILAKVTRDRIMVDLDRRWPQYGFKQHKGYGTQMHREAIEKFGPCEIHRRSFDPIRTMLQVDFLSTLL